MHFSVNDAIYWYNIEGSGAPIVMLHGFTGTSATWDHFVNQYKSRFQVITIDLPGHGKTVNRTPRTMETCCHELMMLLQSLQLKRFHIAGYSMGGRTALSLAMIYPEAVKTLILESASPGLATEAERVARRKKDDELAERIVKEGVEKFVAYWENIPLFQTQKQLPIALQEAIRKERLQQSKTGLAASLKNMGTGRQPNWWDKLQHFYQPVLLLAGEKDKKFVHINERMNRRFPNSQLEVVAGSGHAIHVEQQAIFGKLVTGFIQNHEE